MKHLLDSNTLIYAARPGAAYAALRQWVQRLDVAVSALVQVEVLGFHSLEAADEIYLRLALARLPELPVTTPILQQAILVCQQFRLKTIDAIIAATALVHDLDLVTADADFVRVAGLTVVNPLVDA